MKNSIFKLFPFVLLLIVVFASCEDEKDAIEDQLTEKLYVKFKNNADSEYTISCIRTLNMGMSGTLSEPTGEFGDNVLTDGQTIAPGEHVFFYLEIPNLHYAYCRLSVLDALGNEVVMNTQTGYTATYEGTFTHWGSDEREVSTSIKYDQYSDYIKVQSWFESAGIDQ